MEKVEKITANSSKFMRILFYCSVGVVLVIILVLSVLLIIWLLLPKRPKPLPKPWRHFIIDYIHDTFIMDGEPFQFVSGEFHYFRAPHQRWRNILRKMKSAGLKCVSTYVEWSSHEPTEGNFRFSGDYDIEQFITTAAEEELYVILRPGPYINADRDFGGFPPWLLYGNEKKIRMLNLAFVRHMEKWFNELFSRLQKHLYGYGGPIIMVQIENDYGSWKHYYRCNEGYRLWLRDVFQYHVGNASVLFTTDKDDASLKCGSIPDVYATINFGPNDDADTKFAEMRKYSPHGPLFNAHFSTGYPCYWKEPRKVIPSEKVKTATMDLLNRNASFNYYMFFGGTNFYFKNGANILTREDGKKVYRPMCTSYDYDAPLNEAGDYTQKYWDIREALLTRDNSPPPDDFQPKTSRKKGKYGTVEMRLVAELLFALSYVSPKVETYLWEPKRFELVGLQYGYLLYTVEIPSPVFLPNAMDHVELTKNFADKMYSYTNAANNPDIIMRLGIRTRDELTDEVNKTIDVEQGGLLQILIENQGRVSSDEMLNDWKGMWDAPKHRTLPLKTWSMLNLPLEDVSWLSNVKSPSSSVINMPAFFRGELVLPKQALPLDTYIDFSGWEEGALYVNNCSLGRFWANVGPQITLFVPRSCLLVHPHKNSIVLFVPYSEMLGGQKVTFTDTPNLG